MRRIDIIRMRKLLKEVSIASQIIGNKEGYYYYYNWQAGQNNKLHYCECGHCAFGSGKRPDAEAGNNGVWIGPFETREIAMQKLQGEFQIDNPEDCIHCANI